VKVIVEIPEYNPTAGFTCNWEYGFTIKTVIEDGTVILSANKEGLISLANHLLNLAQDSIKAGTHLHLDEYNSLENGSNELIISKVE
jgi:hypothetical protein